jgi:hypothetical protein
MFAGIVSSVKAEQFKMAPMLTIVSGMTRNLNPEQPQNTECPMCVTPEEIINRVEPGQSQKASFPIFATLEGMVTSEGVVKCCKPEHS